MCLLIHYQLINNNDLPVKPGPCPDSDISDNAIWVQSAASVKVCALWLLSTYRIVIYVNNTRSEEQSFWNISAHNCTVMIAIVAIFICQALSAIARIDRFSFCT